MRDNCWSVYWLLLPDGKWYFGKAKNASERLYCHKTHKTSGNHDYVTYEILRSDLTEVEARQYETELIKTLPCINKMISCRNEDALDTIVRKAFGYTCREWKSLGKDARAYCRRVYDKHEVRSP